MIGAAVTISLVPEARGGPFVFWDDLAAGCAAAARHGFDAVEVFPPGPHEVDRRALGQLLETHSLRLAAMGTGAGWLRHRLHLTQADPQARRQARQFVREMVDLAGQFSAPAIVGSMQGRWGDGVDRNTALGWLAEALDGLGRHARQYRVPLLYEPLNRYETNLVSTLEAGVELVAPLADGNVRLLADLFHMNIEEVDLAAALCRAGSHVGHVHFVDSNRRPAGAGHLDFAPIVAALRQIAYSGYLSAEALPFPDPHAAAEQTIASFRRLVKSE